MKIGKDQTVVLGPPGCGKTTDLLGKVEACLADGINPDRIGFVSFTRKAITEATSRACEKFNLTHSDFPYFKTIHSLCFALVEAKRPDIVGREHMVELGKILGYKFGGFFDESETGMPTGTDKGDQLLFIDNFARVTMRTLKEAWTKANADLSWHEQERMSTAYKTFKDNHGLVDFTDLLTVAIEKDIVVDLDVVFIDEAQDLSRLQWKVLQSVFRNVPQVYIAGDDDQCQPPETLVRTTKGYKRIDELDPAIDELVAYSRSDAQVFGLRSGGYKFAVTKRPYVGTLHEVSAGCEKSLCTPSHKWLVKWRKEIKTWGLCCVYLMKRGDWFRVGWCQLFDADGASHLNVRANIEKADSVWVLKVFEGRRNASVYESIVAAKYGIPTSTFEPVLQSQYITRESIDTIFSSVDSKTGAIKAMYDNGRLIDFPFIDRLKATYSRFGSSVMEMQACNLLSELMEIPTFTGHKEVTWEKVSIDDVQFSGHVYSLDVEKYHTYIADGLVTCNSIYKWSGADVDTFLNLPGKKELLSQSYRVPRLIHRVSSNIITSIKNRYAKPYKPKDEEGSIDKCQHLDYIKWSDEGTVLLLARNVYLLKRYEGMLRKRGMPYVMRGGVSSVKAGHVEAILAWEALRKGEAITGRSAKRMYEYIRTGRNLKRGGKTTIVQLHDKDMVAKEQLIENHHLVSVNEIWHDALDAIELDQREFYLAILRQKRKLTAPPMIAINTIHGVKGGEADHVIVLADMSWKTYQEYQKSPDQEHRIMYVAVTRAKKRLTIIQPSSQLAYNFPW